MSIPSITITKIDHDSWWGYYINDDLYGYDDYYNFSDKEVKLEGVLKAIDAGLIKNRKSPLDIKFEHHTDWAFMNSDLFELGFEEFSSALPQTLTELKNWYLEKVNQ